MAPHTPGNDLANLAGLIAAFPQRRVLCVGDVMVDRSFYGEVKRISPEAPIPVVRIVRESSTLGGAGNVVDRKSTRLNSSHT